MEDNKLVQELISLRFNSCNDDFLKKYNSLSEELKQKYNQEYLKSVFNSSPTKEPLEFLSKDKKYKLIVNTYAAGKGIWDFSKGTIINNHTHDILIEIKRNFISFPFKFIDHTNGLSYLICGEDYQGITVVNLESGDFYSKKYGFCPANYKYHANQNILEVEGCYWGAPYEYIFYDFSQPLEKLQEISLIYPGFECDQDCDSTCEGHFILYSESKIEFSGEELICRFIDENQYQQIIIFKRQGFNYIKI